MAPPKPTVVSSALSACSSQGFQLTGSILALPTALPPSSSPASPLKPKGFLMLGQQLGRVLGPVEAVTSEEETGSESLSHCVLPGA